MWPASSAPPLNAQLARQTFASCPPSKAVSQVSYIMLRIKVDEQNKWRALFSCLPFFSTHCHSNHFEAILDWKSALAINSKTSAVCNDQPCIFFQHPLRMSKLHSTCQSPIPSILSPVNLVSCQMSILCHQDISHTDMDHLTAKKVALTKTSGTQNTDWAIYECRHF